MEDLHRADASSLRMLAYVAATPAPVLFIGTRRTPEQGGSDALTAALGALSRSGAERIRLDGLTVEEVSELLAREIGPHSRVLAQVVADRTDGNPFFVIEFARLLRARVITNPEEAARLAAPEGIGDLLRLRLQRLPDDTTALLAIAAVAGRAVDPALLSAVSGAPRPDVLAALDVAHTAGLLTDDGRGYLFAHALVRETIYADLPAGRRIHLHAAVADGLQDRLAADPEIRTELAHRYRLAASLDPGYAAQAVEHLRAAAHIADTRNAVAESAVLWRQAVAASTLTSAPDPLLRYHLVLAQATAELRIGELSDARDHVGQAVAIAESMQRWDLVGEAATALTNAGVWSWRTYGTTDPAMTETLKRCLDHLPHGTLAARVLANLQMEHYYSRRLVEAERYGRRSVAMARAAGDPGVLLRVLLMRALGTWGPGTHTERIELAEEMLTLPMPGELEVGALFQYGAALHQAGRPADADRIMDRCLAVAGRLRHTAADVPLAWWRFMRAVESDDPHLRAIGAALDLHRRTAIVTIDELSGVHAIRTAPPGAAVPTDTVWRAAASRNPGFRALIAYALLESGDPEGAAALLGPAAVGEAPDYAALAADCLRIAVHAGAGITSPVRDGMDRILRWSGDVVTYGNADHLGAVDFFISAGLAALGERDRARAHALAAVELCARVGNKPWERRPRAQLTSLG